MPGEDHLEEGSTLVTKPSLSMKYKMHPPQPAGLDTNIIALLDEYDLGEFTTFSMQDILS